MPRRLLIVEYLCAGFLDLADALPSVLADGQAMLIALLEDASRIERTQIATLWTDRLGELSTPGVHVHSTTSCGDASDAWCSALGAADVVYLIAPETSGILQRMCNEAADAGAQVLSCT